MQNKGVLYHLIFWALAYFFWIFIFRNSTLVFTQALTIQFCYLIFIAANFYFNTLYTVPFLLEKKRYTPFALLFLGGILFCALARVPLSIWVSAHVFGIKNAHPDFLVIFFNSFVNIFFWVLLLLAANMISQQIQSRRYIEHIEKEKAANELNFLRAQFNPHFLFNSINSIYGHIDKSNKGARDMLLVFSEMLRYQLYECNVEQIGLDREVNYLKNYIALQRSRMDERINIEFKAEGLDATRKIAPLVFIAFIENAFKFVGFREGEENLIQILLTCREDSLYFNVFNTKDRMINPIEKSSGLGIANVRRRLELIYPDKHLLRIDDRMNHFEVVLTLFSEDA